MAIIKTPDVNDASLKEVSTENINTENVNTIINNVSQELANQEQVEIENINNQLNTLDDIVNSEIQNTIQQEPQEPKDPQEPQELQKTQEPQQNNIQDESNVNAYLQGYDLNPSLTIGNNFSIGEFYKELSQNNTNVPSFTLDTNIGRYLQKNNELENRLATAYSEQNSFSNQSKQEQYQRASRILNIPVEQIELAPDELIKVANKKEFKDYVSNNPALMVILKNPDNVKYLTKTKAQKIVDAQSVWDNYSDGWGYSEKSILQGKLATEIVNLQIEGKDIPLRLTNQYSQITKELQELESSGDTFGHWAGSMINGLLYSLGQSADEALIGAVGGATSFGVVGGAPLAATGAIKGVTYGLVEGLAEDAKNQFVNEVNKIVLENNIDLSDEDVNYINKNAWLIYGLNLLQINPAESLISKPALRIAAQTFFKDYFGKKALNKLAENTAQKELTKATLTKSAQTFLNNKLSQSVAKALVSKPLSNYAKVVSESAITNAIIGGGTQFGTNIVQNTIADTPEQQVASDFNVLEATKQGAIGGAVFGGLFATPSLLVDIHLNNKSKKHNEQRAKSDEILSSIDGGDTEGNRTLVNTLNQELNQSYYFLRADKVMEIANNNPEALNEIKQVIPNFDNLLNDALTTGQDIAIDPAIWTFKLRKTKIGKELSEHLTTKEGDFTQYETVLNEESLNEEAKQEYQKLVEEREKETQFNIEKKEIEEELRVQFKETDLANKHATQGLHLYSAFITTTARRLGIMPKQAWEMLKVTIKNSANENVRGGYSRDESTIFFNKKSDASTVVHEGAHWFLDKVSILAKQSTEYKNIMNGFLDWLIDEDSLKASGKQSKFELWESWTDEEKVKSHEKFAEAWEKYLSDPTNAPTRGLRDLFQYFTSWIKQAYRSFRELIKAERPTDKLDSIELPSDVKRFFDMLIATDDAIEFMNRNIIYKPLFDENILKVLINKEHYDSLSDEDKKYYSELLQNLYGDVEEYIQFSQAKKFKAMAKKRDNILAKLDREQEKLLRTLEKDELEKIKNSKEYLALKDIKKGFIVEFTRTTKKGKKQTVRRTVKSLNVNEIAQLTNNDTKLINAMVKRRIASDNGASVLGLLEIYDVEDPKAFFEAILEVSSNAKDLEKLAKKRAQARFESEYNGIVTREAREELINKILSSELISQLNAIELRALSKTNIKAFDLLQAARDVAKVFVKNSSVKNLRESSYFMKEQRLQKLAFRAMAKGDIPVALEYKRQALLNREIGREIIRVNKYKAKVFKTLSKVSRLNPDNYDKNWTILAHLFAYKTGFAKNSPTIPNDFLELIAEDEHLSMMYQEIKDAPFFTFDEMNVDQFITFATQFEALINKARSEKLYTLNGIAYKVDTIIGNMVEHLRKLYPNKKGNIDYGVSNTPTTKEQFFNNIKTLNLKTRSVEFLCSELDGYIEKGKEQGFFTKYIFTPIRKVSVKSDQIYQKKMKAIADALVETDIKGLQTKQVYEFNGKKFTFNADPKARKFELLMLLLHASNPDNWQKFVLGGRTRNKGKSARDVHPFGYLNEDGTLNDTDIKQFIVKLIDDGVITKKHFELVNTIIQQFKDLQPDVQKAFYKENGKYMKEVTGDNALADIALSKFGIKLNGGYIPAMLDKSLFDMDVSTPVNALDVDFNRALTPSAKDNFTIERVKGATGGLSLDFGSVLSALRDQIHYAYVMPTVMDVDKLISHPEFKYEIDRVAPNAVETVFKPWLNGVAKRQTSDLRQDQFLKKFATLLSNRSTMMIMSANLKNAVQQVTGLFLAINKVNPTYIIKGIYQTLTNWDLSKEVFELSPFMKERYSFEEWKIEKTFNKAIYDSPFQNFFSRQQAMSNRWMYWLQTLFQKPIDLSVWKGAFDEFMEKSTIEDMELRRQEAISQADQAVAQTQSSMRYEDLTELQRNQTAMWKLFNMFTGYFYMLRNLKPLKYQEFRQKFGYKNATPAMLASFATVFFIPSLMSEVIVSLLNGKYWEENDDKEWYDILESNLVRATLITPLAAYLPYVGAGIGNLATSKLLDEYNPTGSVLTSVPLSLAEQYGRLPINIAKNINDERDWTHKDIEQMIRLTGGILGMFQFQTAAEVYKWASKIDDNKTID